MHCLKNEEARSSVSCSLLIASVRSQPQMTDYTVVRHVCHTQTYDILCSDRRHSL